MAHIKYGNMGKTIPNMDENGGSGSSLPAVTSADKGKVLQVNSSGQWAAGPYVLEATVNGNTTTLNASYDDLYGAFVNGAEICYLSFSEGESYNEVAKYTLIGMSESVTPGSYYANFYSSYYESGIIFIANESTANMSYEEIPT